MSIGKVLGGTIIVTPAVGVVGYVTYDQLYNSETVAVKSTRASSGEFVNRELNLQEAAAVGINEEDMVDVTYSSHSR